MTTQRPVLRGGPPATDHGVPVGLVVPGPTGADRALDEQVDGGLSRDRRLLRLQADTAGRAVGAGVVEDLGAAADLLEHGEALEPSGDPSRRAAERAAWRSWVEAASALPTT